MSDPVTDEVVTEQDESAAFEAGFAKANGDEPPVVSEAPKEEVVAETPAPEAPQEEQITLSAADAKALIARLEDLDKLKALSDKAFGKLGSLNETVMKLQQSGGTGKPIEISEEDLAELSEYGELKGSLASVLKKVLPKVSGGAAPTIDLSSVESRFQQQLEERDRKYEARVLTAMHRDWRQTVTSEDYRLWLQGQDEEYRTRIASSWNAEEVGDSLERFAASRKTAEPAQKQNKARRLEAAVTPTGNASAAPVLDENDAFMRGFRNVASKRL